MRTCVRARHPKSSHYLRLLKFTHLGDLGDLIGSGLSHVVGYLQASLEAPHSRTLLFRLGDEVADLRFAVLYRRRQLLDPQPLVRDVPLVGAARRGVGEGCGEARDEDA
jgi:hypothetical protein